MNLQCNLVGPGPRCELKYKDPADGEVKQLPNGAPIVAEDGQPLTFDGQRRNRRSTAGRHGFPATIPYVLLVALMVGSTFYQHLADAASEPAGLVDLAAAGDHCS